MRVLWLYYENPNGDMNRISKRLHYDFVVKLRKHCSSFMIYGPGNRQSEISPLLYSNKLDWTHINRKLKPDVVLMYSGTNVHKFIPAGFGSATVVKVMMECDYWFNRPRFREKYKDWRINLMIQRGYYEDRGLRIPSVWLPFSANEIEFKKNQVRSLSVRKKLIGFVGRGGTDTTPHSLYYGNRREIMNDLSSQGLVKHIGKVGHSKYPDELSRFFCYITDTGRDDSPPGKVFEIMASGALLFTTPFKGKKELFGDDEVCVFYEKDRSNVVDKAREILKSDPRYLQPIVDRAVNVINEKHLDRHRVKEFYDTLTSYYNTGTVEKKWGI